jgi:hypothetical protein
MLAVVMHIRVTETGGEDVAMLISKVRMAVAAHDAA